jgi:dienelactone hydrolase
MPRRLPLALTATLLSIATGPARAQALPGTALWDDRDDPSAAMVAGIGRFLDREIAASVGRRPEAWKGDLATPGPEADPVAPVRERFVKIIGAVGERVRPVEMAYVATTDSPAKVAETSTLAVFAVRWGVYPGVEAEGLLLEPKGPPRGNVVAMADCDTTPEQFAGLAPGLDRASQVPRLLAEAGFRVLVPTLIDRTDEFSGNPKVRMTNLSHREWIYRMAYETGRHPIGYEVDKVRSAVDWFSREGQPKLPIGVMGHGEGGLIALYSAAADPRIEAAWVAGYFGPREEVWKEPIDRNVWGLLERFGDAEIARLIAPRALLVEACPAPEVAGPPPPRNGRNDAAPGRIVNRKASEVRAEWERIASLEGLSPGGKPLKGTFVESAARLNEDDRALGAFLPLLGVPVRSEPSSTALTDARPHFNPRERMGRQVRQLVDYTQAVVRTSELRRYDYWSKADTSSVEKWVATTEPYRNAFWDDLIGRFPPASEPLKARTKPLYDEPKWTGYAVELPVWPDVVASGILLLPKDLKEGERRPVVVCQHGLEGKPEDVSDPKIQSVYHAYAAQLADRGYIVYAPQNPYIGKDAFRVLQRKAHPLKRSLFAVIIRQHERTLEWLKSLPNVDPARIAFYGLSYGGKTAMRVPAVLKDYCLSICSADFNEWVVKNTSIDRQYSYMFTLEYDMYEFGLAERFNYAEMAALIAPRPFQVERGHKDGVAPDEWIGYEYAKVKRTYDTLGLADRTGIAYFNDGHMIDGKETFAFLARHLNWPRGAAGEGEGR